MTHNDTLTCAIMLLSRNRYTLFPLIFSRLIAGYFIAQKGGGIVTEKQKMFCNEYLIDLNATRAYKKIYVNCKKDEAAAAASARLLRNVNVQNYVNQRIKDREKRTEITQDLVLNELRAIATANGSEFARIVEREMVDPFSGKTIFDSSGMPMKYQAVELVLTDSLPDEKKKAIAGIKQGKNGIEIATCDKIRALELLGRHLGMFKDNVDITIKQSEKLAEVMDQLGGDGLEE